MKKFPVNSIDLILTDMPYGTTHCKWDAFVDLDSMWSCFEHCMKTNCAIIFTACQPFATTLINSNQKLFRYDLIWNKKWATGFLNSKRMPLRSHELLLVFYKKLPIYNPQFTKGAAYSMKRQAVKASKIYNSQIDMVGKNSGIRYPKSIIEITQIVKRKGHPTQKPVELFEYLIKTFSNKNNIVLDPFIGSGTAAIACLNTGRKYIGIEKEFKYYKMCLRRIQKYYGNYKKNNNVSKR